MKVLSDNAITRADLNGVDKKQNEQIQKLRTVVALSAAGNFIFTLVVLSLVLFKA